MIRRSAIGRARGLFRDLDVAALGAPAVRAALADAGLAADELDEVRLGNTLEGGNVARRVALAAGLAPAMPAFTLDRQCTSGLDTIIEGFARVAGGQADAVLVGGAESVTTAPRRVAAVACRDREPEIMARAPFSAPPYDDPDPVAVADALAANYGVARADQDAWTVRSHRNAVAAERAGDFDAERIAVTGGETAARDQAPRDDLEPHRLARLPSLRHGGTATAANTAPAADGAAIGLVMTLNRARRLAIHHALVLEAHAFSGCDPAAAGYAAVSALARLVAKQALGDFDRVEFNEAFAGQTLVCLRAAGLHAERVCQRGGALAFGHPFGASGALLVCRLFHDLAPGQRGLATLSAMGGQGSAAAFTAIDPSAHSNPARSVGHAHGMTVPLR